jgi:predicted RNase H-like nuclease (RuvC/YqgF family)
MIEVKDININDLVSSIYECQKKIIMNKRFIRELDNEGSDTARLKVEVFQLERKIEEFQKQLRRKYQMA